MRTKVTEEGVLVPPQFLKGIKEVEIKEENGLILVVPLTDDEAENEDFYNLSLRGLADAYGEDEPEYSLDLIKEHNDEYEGR